MDGRKALAPCSSIRFCFPKVEFCRPLFPGLWPLVGPLQQMQPHWILDAFQQAAIVQSSAPGAQMRGNPPLSGRPPPACHAPHPQRTEENTRTPHQDQELQQKEGGRRARFMRAPAARPCSLGATAPTQTPTRQRHKRKTPPHPSRSRQSKAKAKQLLAGLGAALQMRRVWLACLGCTCIVSVRAVAQPTATTSQDALREDREGKTDWETLSWQSSFCGILGGWLGWRGKEKIPLSSLANATLPANATCLPTAGAPFTPRSLFTPWPIAKS
jgi:hypothetical protein